MSVDMKILPPDDGASTYDTRRVDCRVKIRRPLAEVVETLLGAPRRA